MKSSGTASKVVNYMASWCIQRCEYIVDIVILVYGFSACDRSSPVALDVFSPGHHFHHMMPQLEWWHFHRRRPSSPAPSWRAKGWWHVITVFLGAALADWKTALSFPRCFGANPEEVIFDNCIILDRPKCCSSPSKSKELHHLNYISTSVPSCTPPWMPRATLGEAS